MAPGVPRENGSLRVTSQVKEPVPGTAAARPQGDDARDAGWNLPGLALRYGGAVAAVAAAAGCRWLLHDLFGEGLAYITFYPLVALVAMLAGGGPGVLATFLSAVVADVWIV